MIGSVHIHIDWVLDFFYSPKIWRMRPLNLLIQKKILFLFAEKIRPTNFRLWLSDILRSIILDDLSWLENSVTLTSVWRTLIEKHIIFCNLCAKVLMSILFLNYLLGIDLFELNIMKLSRFLRNHFLKSLSLAKVIENWRIIAFERNRALRQIFENFLLQKKFSTWSTLRIYLQTSINQKFNVLRNPLFEDQFRTLFIRLHLENIMRVEWSSFM